MVLPFISPLSGSPRLASCAVDVPPPLRFKPLVGKPRNISVGAQRVQVQIHPSMPVAKAAGIRYEWQVYGWLSEGLELAAPIHIQHCIHFSDDAGYRTVVPDAFVVLEKYVVLFEVKSQHMPETWWQCEKLYKPLLEGLFSRQVFCVEIVKSFDGQMPFPVPIELIDDLKKWVEGPSAPWSVFKWRKRT